jgi:hypothetical protein
MAGFNYPDFSSTAGLNLVGDTAVSGTALRLTEAPAGGIGAVWHDDKVPVHGAWTCEFTFQVTDGGGIANPGHDSHGPGGDGFVFLVQNSTATEIRSGGSQLGYSAIPDSIAFEFDLYDDFTFGDISDNELSVHSKGTAPNSSFATGIIDSLALVTPNMKDGSVHTVRIVHDPGVGADIYVDDMDTPAFTVAFDLSALLSLTGGAAWVGFTASTGAAYETHDILSWSFSYDTAAISHRFGLG